MAEFEKTVDYIIVDVRAVPVPPAAMQPHPVRRYAVERRVQGGDMQFHRLQEHSKRLVLEHHRPLHSEIGRIDLEDKAAIDNDPVFLGHFRRQGEDVLLVSVVMGVMQARRDNAG